VLFPRVMPTLASLARRFRPLAAASVGGILSTIVDVAVLAALIHRGVAIPIAAFTGAISGAGICFVANKYVAFRDHRPADVRQIAAFAAVALATAALMALAMYVACDRGHLPYLTAKALCASVVFVCWSYPAQRRLVFA
jgi:putative flippase GtrA